MPSTRQKRFSNDTGRPQAVNHPLTQAFATFTNAADSLKHFYGQLQVEVGHLRRELERTNRDLAHSLQENQRIRAYLGRILESLPCGVVVMDPDGRLRIANPEALRLLAVESKGSRQNALPVSGMLERLLSEVSFDGSVGEQEWTVENSGEVRYIGVTRTSLPKENTSRAESVFILRDTTAEKQFQKEREAARRTQALAEMATLLAHEVRNPLGSLELFAGLLADTTDSASEARQWVDHLQAGLRTLAATVNNVLQFHSQPAPQLVPVDVVLLLRETVEFLRPLARQRNMHIDFVPSTGEALILAEPHCLQQVFFNLAINAFRAMPPGGCVQVRAGCVAQGNGQEVQIEFADNGKGIDPENLGKLFAPGFTTNPGSPGLGLAVSQKIVEQHGGTIHVRSTLRQGTTFTFNFPITGAAG